jgi:hypothetical protein
MLQNEAFEKKLDNALPLLSVVNSLSWVEAGAVYNWSVSCGTTNVCLILIAHQMEYCSGHHQRLPHLDHTVLVESQGYSIMMVLQTNTKTMVYPEPFPFLLPMDAAG